MGVNSGGLIFRLALVYHESDAMKASILDRVEFPILILTSWLMEDVRTVVLHRPAHRKEVVETIV